MASIFCLSAHTLVDEQEQVSTAYSGVNSHQKDYLKSGGDGDSQLPHCWGHPLPTTKGMPPTSKTPNLWVEDQLY